MCPALLREGSGREVLTFAPDRRLIVPVAEAADEDRT